MLESLDVPSNQKHNACLEWMMIRANQGLDDGTLRKSDALEQRLLDQLCQLRGTYATIGDKLSCRMPLPYTHFVQVLVDTFIALSPFALYADLGVYSVIGCGEFFATRVWQHLRWALTISCLQLSDTRLYFSFPNQAF